MNFDRDFTFVWLHIHIFSQVCNCYSLCVIFQQMSYLGIITLCYFDVISTMVLLWKKKLRKIDFDPYWVLVRYHELDK